MPTLRACLTSAGMASAAPSVSHMYPSISSSRALAAASCSCCDMCRLSSLLKLDRKLRCASGVVNTMTTPVALLVGPGPTTSTPAACSCARANSPRASLPPTQPVMPTRTLSVLAVLAGVELLLSLRSCAAVSCPRPTRVLARDPPALTCKQAENHIQVAWPCCWCEQWEQQGGGVSVTAAAQQGADVSLLAATAWYDGA